MTLSRMHVSRTTRGRTVLPLSLETCQKQVFLILSSKKHCHLGLILRKKKFKHYQPPPPLVKNKKKHYQPLIHNQQKQKSFIALENIFPGGLVTVLATCVGRSSLKFVKFCIKIWIFASLIIIGQFIHLILT